jgi:hypothetical protein
MIRSSVIDALIKHAKLGRERKYAQVETCSVFAAALYDVLVENGIAGTIVTAVQREPVRWAHSVVQVEGKFFDSMGEFSTDIYRERARIHPSVTLEIEYVSDVRDECYESDYEELHSYFVKQLSKAFVGELKTSVRRSL